MWANTFYPGVMERSQAARVALHAGWDLPGYDIRLQAVPVYRAAGVVLGEDGKRAAGVQVGIDLADPWEHDSDGTTSREDGRFEFPSVHQGDWRLMGMRQRGETVFKGFAEALVARHDLENLAIRLAPPFSISGKVEWDESRDPKAGPPIKAVILESATRGASATGSTGRDGTFRIDNVFADRYKIPQWDLRPGTTRHSSCSANARSWTRWWNWRRALRPCALYSNRQPAACKAPWKRAPEPPLSCCRRTRRASIISSSGRRNAMARAGTISAVSGPASTTRWLSAAPTSSRWKTAILSALSPARPSPCTWTTTSWPQSRSS